jgi:hypothetical protein
MAANKASTTKSRSRKKKNLADDPEVQRMIDNAVAQHKAANSAPAASDDSPLASAFAEALRASGVSTGIGSIASNTEKLTEQFGDMDEMVTEIFAKSQGKKVENGKVVDRTWTEKAGDLAADIGVSAAGAGVALGVAAGVTALYGHLTSSDD